MTPLSAQIESLLFASGKPLTLKKIITLTSAIPEDVRHALDALLGEYNAAKRGIRILCDGDRYQMTTAPEWSKLVRGLVTDDVQGDLTRPQLETITILAYRGPMTKAALEEIRGVNCALILRNLAIRGLIDEEEDTTQMQTLYHVSFDFLRWLGVHTVEELPRYQELHNDSRVDQILALAAEVGARQGEQQVIRS